MYFECRSAAWNECAWERCSPAEESLKERYDSDSGNEEILRKEDFESMDDLRT
jgi:hypothetical protein